MANKYELLIQNGSKIYDPVVEGEINWETVRKGTPGKLTFNVVNDGRIELQEGNAVRFKVNNQNVFFGFVFTKKQTKENIISVTAYDQLRYLKNKDTYVYAKKTASDVIKMIAKDFKLNLGTIENTGYVIASRVEDNKTLFDIIQNALDITLQNTKKMYVLYDDFGKLTLKNIENMKLNIVIDKETAEDFDYTSSIDEETYNKVKLVFENKDKGKRKVYIAQDSNNINKWGVLQYFDTLKEGEDGKTKANALLSLYNKKTRRLTIRNAIGDVRVRAGTMVIVNLNIGDLKLQNYMIVEEARHRFAESEHFMDLKLIGGDFVA